MTSDQQKNPILDPSVISRAVSLLYGGNNNNIVGEIKRTSLIRAGFNHNYQVEAKNGTKYVLRVYLNGKYYIKDDDDLRFELELLHYLASEKGLPVVRPIATESGDLLGVMEEDQYRRRFALFHFAKGAPLEEQMSKMGRKQFYKLGQLVAEVHVAADEFETPHHRYHLNDETYLLDASLEVIDREYQKKKKKNDGTSTLGADLSFFQPFAEKLRQKLEPLPRTVPEYGIIHSDLHLGNIYWDEKANEFTIIDFDHCACGWRAYDIAPCTELGRDTCHFLLEGYESVRPLSDVEKDSFSTFNALREVWDIGDNALYMPLWGRPIDENFLQDAKQQLRCLMDPVPCQPSVIESLVFFVVNTSVWLILVWLLVKTVRRYYPPLRLWIVKNAVVVRTFKR